LKLTTTFWSLEIMMWRSPSEASLMSSE
jgi:hypothetical protein